MKGPVLTPQPHCSRITCHDETSLCLPPHLVVGSFGSSGNQQRANARAKVCQALLFVRQAKWTGVQFNLTACVKREPGMKAPTKVDFALERTTKHPLYISEDRVLSFSLSRVCPKAYALRVARAVPREHDHKLRNWKPPPSLKPILSCDINISSSSTRNQRCRPSIQVATCCCGRQTSKAGCYLKPRESGFQWRPEPVGSRVVAAYRKDRQLSGSEHEQYSERSEAAT